MKINNQRALELPEFKIRASAIGKIMMEARGATITELQLKKIVELKARATRTPKMEEELARLTDKRDAPPTLSETAKAFAIQWVKEQLYDHKKEIESKYLIKGNGCEADAIKFSDKIYKYGCISTDNKELSNDFITGTPDIIANDLIVDIKNSWDCFTFPLFAKDIPNTDYDWQVKGYMSLTGRRSGAVVYTLMDTPDELIEREYWKAMGTSPTEQKYETAEDGTGAQSVLDYTEDFKEFAKNFKYEGIDENIRIKRFPVLWNDEAIKRVEERVRMMRVFIKGLSI